MKFILSSTQRPRNLTITSLQLVPTLSISAVPIRSGGIKFLLRFLFAYKMYFVLLRFKVSLLQLNHCCAVTSWLEALVIKSWRLSLELGGGFFRLFSQSILYNCVDIVIEFCKAYWQAHYLCYNWWNFCSYQMPLDVRKTTKSMCIIGKNLPNYAPAFWCLLDI